MKNFSTYLQAKNLSPSTQNAYLRYVTLFLDRTDKPETQITKADVIAHLHYLKTSRGQQNISRKNSLIALHHYFSCLQDNGHISSLPTALLKIRGTKSKKLYHIFSAEDLQQLYQDYYHSFISAYNDHHIPKNQRKTAALSRNRNYCMLGLLLFQGLHTSELQNIGLDDIDLNQARVFIKGGRKSTDRTLPLNAEQIGALMLYIQNIRPQLLDYRQAQHPQLFLPLPEVGKTSTQSTQLMGVFKPLSRQMKTLDSHFLNFKQIRAAVITHWIQSLGLRKAQYMAGHRYISSTERYLPNDLESLTDDMAKFNPF